LGQVTHTSAVSLPPSDIIFDLLACPVNDIILLSTSGNLSTNIVVLNLSYFVALIKTSLDLTFQVSRLCQSQPPSIVTKAKVPGIEYMSE
jgi:hypothetical protein